MTSQDYPWANFVHQCQQLDTTSHLALLQSRELLVAGTAQAGAALSVTPFVIFFKEQGNGNGRPENEKQQDSLLWYKQHSVARDFHQSRSVQTGAAECL